MLQESASSLVGDFGRGWVDLLDKWMSGEQGAFPLLGAAAVTVGATMGFGLWMASRGGNKIDPLVDPHMQTKELEDGSRVCKYLKDGKFMSYLYDDAKTLYECIRRGMRVSNNGPMLGYRKKMSDGSEPYIWLTYKEIIDKSVNVAMGLRELGLKQGQETFIGIYSKNRPEWIIAEHASYTHNNVIVPLYETLGADACAFIINQADIQLVFCDAVSKAVALLKEQKEKCPTLRFLVVCEPITDDLKKSADAQNVRVITFEGLETLGRGAKTRPEPTPPTPEDLATICYTSGTTGTPKGVMLTHANVVADCTTLTYFKLSGPNQGDVMISFLPLAHMLERVLEAVCFMVGARVGFFRGDIRLLTDDIKELRPTLVPVVPRVLNRIYDKVMQEVNKSSLKRALFDWGVAAKTRELNCAIVRNNSIWDKVVFKKIREGMGGRVRLMITGSAPLAENVLTFIRAAMGCIVVEGYGQTECVAACTVTMEGDNTPGHVGMPSPCCAIKLIDVPELGYFTKDRAGEVCIKGTNVFKGYYKNPEQTAETIDADGWLHTGDIGRWTNTGTLKIVDRKKHIFKLSQGEYVAPEKIENIYVRSKYVAQSFVHGDSLKSCLIAVVVPDHEVLPSAVAQALGIKSESIEALCKNDAVKKLILDDMIKIGKESGLFTFEQVRDIFLSPEMFSVENNLLTPTLKSKRPQLLEHFRDQLSAMYKNLD